MLIEFSVQNHRSFRERQTFSMVAGVGASRDDTHAMETGSNGAPFALRLACLYGANGSGKSSLIDAMQFMCHFVRRSFKDNKDGRIKTEPFLFHSEWRDQPSEFEVVFLHNDSLYQYGFSVDRTRIWNEWLFERPNKTGRQRQIFTRSYDSETEAYDWDLSATYLKGERDSWRNQTRPDALFLTTAVHLNSESLKAPFEWINQGFRTLYNGDPSIEGLTASAFSIEGWKERVLNLLKDVDISLADIEVKEKSFFQSPDFTQLPKEVQEHLRESNPDAKIHDVQTVRLDNAKRNVRLPLYKESSGTQTLFDLIGPWLDVLDKGLTLVVDELNNGLHPLAFQHMIGLFCDPKINKNGAQLIFTTHDTSVTENDCIHRDQIWLVEKGDNLASVLTPLSDFKPRDTRGFQKDYLHGRFGAVPRLRVS
jgi:uncharacterized protein